MNSAATHFEFCKGFLLSIDIGRKAELCMNELRDALERTDCLIAPVFLSR